MSDARSRWQQLAVWTLLAVSGCGHDDWTVLRQATPNRLQQQRAFFVEPIHFERMLVHGMPEAEFLANKSTRSIESWEIDKLDMSRLFYETLARHAKGLQLSPMPSASQGAFIIRPICTFIEPGDFLNTVTTFAVRVQILDPADALVDEVSTGGNVAPAWYQPSSGGRLRSAAKIAGENVADYLRSRTGG